MIHTFNWSPDLSVGNRQIDQQHMRLISYCEKAAASLSQSKIEIAAFHGMLNDVAELMRNHFTTEEAYLRSSQYPYLRAHVDDHRRIHTMITAELCKAFDRNGIESTGFENSLNYWMNHFLEFDLKAKRYLSESA